jgi:DnaJ-class molecular chaperone
MSAHTHGCKYDHEAGRYTDRGAGCAAPEEHGICGDCNGRGWHRAIRDWRMGDDDPVNRVPCRVCDGSGRKGPRHAE